MSNLFFFSSKYRVLNFFFNTILLIIITILFIFVTFQKLGITLNFSILVDYIPQLKNGFKMTLIISVLSLFLSMFIGSLTAYFYNSKIVIVSYLAQYYIQLIRGTPLLVQIYFFYYIVGNAWGLDNRYLAGILILSIFEGAYIAEIIRGGLTSISPQQYEIAKSIGLKKIQTFYLIIFPQLMIRILPSLAGQFASIIKDSSLLSVVAIIELTQITQEISSINYALFENYLFLGVLYLLLTIPISLLSKYLEKRFHYAY
ncbi:MAG: amino acid ABC transporter permease [Brevinema sp.]